MSEEAKLCRRLRQIAHGHPRWGWKMAHQLLGRDGWPIHKKRTQRLWRKEGLRRPQRCRKRRRVHPKSAVRLAGTHPNHVWANDFHFDETSDDRRLKLANVVDEFTQESLATEVDRSITANHLIDVLERLAVMHGPPEHLRMDNEPELLSWALGDWCRLGSTQTIYIEPGSPWENPFVETFNSRSRDELLNIEEFATLREARTVVETWRTSSSGSGLTNT